MRIRPTALEQTGTAANYNINFGSGSTVCSVVPAYADASTESAATLFTVGSGVLTIGFAGSGRANTTTTYLGWSAEL
jgi:hypothetical protein